MEIERIDAPLFASVEKNNKLNAKREWSKCAVVYECSVQALHKRINNKQLPIIFSHYISVYFPSIKFCLTI